jgi:hypothetical protein
MAFRVLKASMDGGMAGREATYATIGDAAQEIYNYSGWETLKTLREAIVAWGQKARPGEVFTTAASAVVCVGLERTPPEDDHCPFCHEESGLDYDDILVAASGDVEQVVRCLSCRKEWVDVYCLASRRLL